MRLGMRQGRTLSIDWPLWAEGEMSPDAATLDAAQRHGFSALTTNEGIQAMYRS